MTNTAKLAIGHSAGCAVHQIIPSKGTTGGFTRLPCSGPPICDYNRAQELAAAADATPWAARAKELDSEHGPYADYAAWEEWIARQFDQECTADNPDSCSCFNCTVYHWWENTDGLTRTAVYAAMAQISRNEELATLRRMAGDVVNKRRDMSKIFNNDAMAIEGKMLDGMIETLEAHLEKEKP